MQITRSTDAALRVLMVLADEHGEQTTVAGLSTQLGVPRHQLAKVVQQLARNGWVATTRGRAGGLRLTDEGLHATVAEVVVGFDGESPVVDCANPPCPLLHSCALQGVLAQAQLAFMTTLAGHTIADLSQTGVRR